MCVQCYRGGAPNLVHTRRSDLSLGMHTPHSQPHSTPNAHPSLSPSATGWVRVSKDTSTLTSKTNKNKEKCPPAPPSGWLPNNPHAHHRARQLPTSHPSPEPVCLSHPPFPAQQQQHPKAFHQTTPIHSTHGTTSSPRRVSLAPPPPPHGHPPPCRERPPSPPC